LSGKILYCEIAAACFLVCSIAYLMLMRHIRQLQIDREERRRKKEERERYAG
jgi:hypothetical protein